jgi:hypothetical protein
LEDLQKKSDIRSQEEQASGAIDMGTNITPDYMRGFLIPDLSVGLESLSPVDSSYTQQTPRAGRAIPQQLKTDMQIVTSGDQTAKITINTEQGGYPSTSARYSWEDANAVKYGRDWYNIVTDWEYWIYKSGVLNTVQHIDAKEIQSGIIITTTEETSALGSFVKTYKKNQGGPLSSSITLGFLAGSPTSPAFPTMARLLDGSLYVIHCTYTTESTVNFTAYRSFDSGDNWQTITTRALTDNINTTAYTITDIRATDSQNGVISLFVTMLDIGAASEDVVAQYRSLDDGLTYSLVGTVSLGDATEKKFHALRPIALSSGGIGIVYIDSTTGLRFRKSNQTNVRLSSLAEDPNAITISTIGLKAAISGNKLINGDLAIYEQNEKLIVVYQSYNTGVKSGFVSFNSGDTWEEIGVTNPAFLPQILDCGNFSDRLTGIFLCAHEGRTILFGLDSASLHAVYLGGFSSVGYPPLYASPSITQYGKWDSTWIPVALPDSSSDWTTSGAGSTTLSINGLDIQTTGNLRSYSYSGTFPVFTKNFLSRFKLAVIQGGTLTGDNIAILYQRDNGSNSFVMSIRFGSAGLAILDNGILVQSVAVSMVDPVEFVLLVDGENVILNYRIADSDHAKSWTTVTQALTPLASGLANSYKWGHFNIAAPTLQSQWWEMHVAAGISAGLFDNSIVPAVYPPFGSYMYIDAGLSITTRSSPARGEESYLINPSYDYPIDNIFIKTTPSQKITWRSKNDSLLQKIAIYTDKVVQKTSETNHLNNLYGFYFGNINWATGKLKRWNGSAWVTVQVIDNTTGLTGTFTRAGATITADSASNQFSLSYNEAQKWRAILEDGEDKHVIQILQNSEGVWGNQATNKRAVLTIDTSLTDPATLPSSGSIKLIPVSSTILIDPLSGVNIGDSALMIEIDQQPTLEGYFQIGTMIYGHVLVMAPQYQRGRIITHEPNLETYETLDGTAYQRKLGDGRKKISLAWTEPIDTTKVIDNDPDFWRIGTAATGSIPVASYGDAPMSVIGMSEILSESQRFVYLPFIKTGGTFQILNRPMNHLYSRLIGDVSIDSVLGDESVNEVFRVSTINIEEGV